MNLAASILEGKPSVTAEQLFRSYTIRSLLDILRFHAAAFLKLAGHLQIFEDHVEARVGSNFAAVTLLPFEQDERDRFAVVEGALEELGLPVSKEHARELFNYINNEDEITAGDLKTLAFALRWSIIHELQSRLLLIVPPERTRWYEMEGTLLGSEIIGRFADLTEDSAEAGNCFALGRYTACVFHLMRIMETVVQQFATQLGATHKDETPLDVKNEDWYQIEQAIERKIKEMPRGDHKTRCSSVLASLSAVKTGWRNPTMHPKATYTDEEALALINAVKLFVKDFTTLD